MQALPIIDVLDEAGEILLGLREGLILLQVHLLPFQGLEETLRAGVVIRVARGGHADPAVGRFEPGDVFTEHYWRDRWYSIKEVRDQGGLLKGWYCDVARPVRVEDGLLISEDLDLDLWRPRTGERCCGLMRMSLRPAASH